jgi:hypothetical protein
MKMKLISIVLLVVGLGMLAMSTHLCFFNDVYDRLDSYHATAQDLYKQAIDAKGTSREAALLEEARAESAVAETAGLHARKTRRTGLLFGLAGLAAIVVSAVPVFISRRGASAGRE